VCEFVQRSDAAGDDEPPVAEVNVVEEKLADGLGSGGVHGG
jgi:hypothetical protein